MVVMWVVLIVFVYFFWCVIEIVKMPQSSANSSIFSKPAALIS